MSTEPRHLRQRQVSVRLSLVDNKYFKGVARQHTAASALAVGPAPWSTLFQRLFIDPNGPWLGMFQVGGLDGDIDGALEVAQERFTQIMAERLAAQALGVCVLSSGGRACPNTVNR